MMQYWTAGKLISNEEVNLVHMTTSQHAGVTFSPFTAKIAWVEETECKVVLRYKDHILTEYNTFNDFYGYETSKTEAIKQAKEIAERMKIEPGSGLIMEVKQTVKRTPCQLTQEPQPGKKLNVKDLGENIYLDEPPLLAELRKSMEDWQNSDFDRTMEVRKQIELQPKITVDRKVIWTSVAGDV